MKYELFFSTKYKHDLRLAVKQGYDISLLNNIIAKLADDIPLEPKYQDHALSGNYKGFRECHILPDWLLIYRKNKKSMLLSIVGVGTHSDLFKK